MKSFSATKVDIEYIVMKMESHHLTIEQLAELIEIKPYNLNRLLEGKHELSEQKKTAIYYLFKGIERGNRITINQRLV
jgi:transcriptional regulator with XRE-family HTH domain